MNLAGFNFVAAEVMRRRARAANFRTGSASLRRRLHPETLTAKRIDGKIVEKKFSGWARARDCLLVARAV
jgi:hypothetical protein